MLGIIEDLTQNCDDDTRLSTWKRFKRFLGLNHLSGAKQRKIERHKKTVHALSDVIQDYEHISKSTKALNAQCATHYTR